MSNILVPIDFSSVSQKALQYGMDLMNKEVDKMLIFHVYQFPIPDPNMPMEMLEEMIESVKEIAEIQVEKILERVRAEYGDAIDIEGKVVPGIPVQGILDELDHQAYDLVVMGMHGQNHVIRKIMGTTATRLIQKSQVPVLVVPEHAQFNSIRRIAYATSLEEEDILAMGKITQLANTLGAEVRCIHIQKENESLDQYKKVLLEEAYKHELNQKPIHIDVLQNEDIIQGLNTYVEYHEIDLLVMLTHKKSIISRIFGGSHTLNMTFQSRVPIWVFQSEKQVVSA